MGSTKTKALISVAKILVAAAIGGAIVYYWEYFRPENMYGDPWYYSYGAGFVCTLMAFLLLSKLSKGSGD